MDSEENPWQQAHIMPKAEEIIEMALERNSVRALYEEIIAQGAIRFLYRETGYWSSDVSE